MNDSTHRLLLVEDDRSLAAMVVDFLSQHGFTVDLETMGDRAVGRIMSECPDGVILDVGLPGLDGFSVCRAVRTKYNGPILILTARGEEVDEVVGLEVGADDYLSKPVRPRVLLARLRTLLRRVNHVSDAATGERIEVGGLVIDASRRVVELRDTPIELTTAEFDLLWLLAQHAGQALSRKVIYDQLEGVKHDGVDRSIDLRISRLRKKLGDDRKQPQRVKSIRGLGYMLVVEP